MLPLVNFPIYGSPDKTASDGRFWPCPDPSCTKSFRQLNGVIAHYHGFHLAPEDIIEDEEGRRFRCPYAGCSARPYQNSNGLAYHLIKVHGEGFEVPEPAPLTSRKDKAIALQNGMRASPETSDQENLHQMPQGMVDAHGEAVVVRKYICPYACGKTYRNSNGLSYHLKKSRCAMTHQLALLATAAVPNTHDNDRKESTTNHHQPTPTPLSATTAQKRKKKMAPATAVDNNDDGPVTIMKKKPRTIAASTEDVTGVQRQRNTENGYLETPMSSAPPSSIRSVNVSLLSPPPPYPSTSAT